MNASPYEMAAMSEEGMITESVTLPPGQSENAELLTDVSIAEQS